MKERLNVTDRGRLNVLIRRETLTNVRIIAAELGMTVQKATDYLLRQAILRYVDNGNSFKEN